MRKKIIKVGVILLTFLSLGLGSANAVSAATLKFSPATGSYTTGNTFTVDITVDTAGKETRGADAVVTFDNTRLSVDSVTYGTFYPTALHSQQNGKLYITGLMNDAANSKSGTGTLATITFKGLTAGTANINFECQTGRTDDSNVYQNDLDSTDLIDCAALGTGSYTLTGGAVNTPTQAPISSPLPDTGGSTSGGSSTGTIPNTGFTDIFAFLPKIAMGVFFLVAGAIPLII